MSQNFGNILVHASLNTYITWLKQFKSRKVPSVVISIMLLDVLTQCTLLHSACDLEATEMNVQHSLIWKLMIFLFKLYHNTIEARKNICYAQGKGAIDHSTVTILLKKFCLGCKNAYDQSAQFVGAVEYVESISAECPRYDTKQFDGKAPAWELWGMWSTSSLPLLPGLLWLWVVAPDRVLSMGQIELFDI